MALVFPNGDDLLDSLRLTTGRVAEAAKAHPHWPRHEVQLASLTAHHPGDGLPDPTDEWKGSA